MGVFHVFKIVQTVPNRVKYESIINEIPIEVFIFLLN